MESFTHNRATCAQYGTRVAWYSYVPASVPESSCSKGTSFSPGGVRKMHPSPSCFSVVHRRLIMWLSWRWLLPKASVLKTSCSELRPLVCAGIGHFFTLCSKREDMGLSSPEDKRFSVWWPTTVFWADTSEVQLVGVLLGYAQNIHMDSASAFDQVVFSLQKSCLSSSPRSSYMDVFLNVSCEHLLGKRMT